MAAYFIYSHFQLTMKVDLSIQLNCRPTLKTICCSFSSVYSTVCMPCVHIRHLKLYASRKFSTYFSSDGLNECNFKVSKNDSMNKNIVILLLLVNRFQESFEKQMYNYPDKFKLVNWISFDVTCKNKRAIFTHYINFTGPLRTWCLSQFE